MAVLGNVEHRRGVALNRAVFRTVPNGGGEAWLCLPMVQFR